MRANQANFKVVTMCRVLGVSPSGYYAWRHRRPSKRAQADQRLIAKIEAFHKRSDGTYGSPRIHRDLRDDGDRVGRKRVARLMRQVGMEGVSRRRRPRTTTRGDEAQRIPDRVQRNFTAEAPDRLWVADITYIWTCAGYLYLAIVLDVFSRRIVGWAMASHLRTSLVVQALDMALDQRRPYGVVHHSDQGTQYTSLLFGERCRKAGVALSNGSVGDCYDNAMAESFFATLECELLERRRFENRAEARLAVFQYIEGWYNPHRRHSALDYLSPVAYERRYEESLSEHAPKVLVGRDHEPIAENFDYSNS